MPHPTRPQITAAQANLYDYRKVLSLTGPAGAEVTDPWDPIADGIATDHADYTVPANTAIQTTVNLAVAEALSSGRETRITIAIPAGTYDGLVYIPDIPAPIRLFGIGDVEIRENIDAEMPVTEYAARFASHFADAPAPVRAIFDGIAGGHGIITTARASVLRIANNGFQASSLTIRNTYNADRVNANNPADTPRNARGQQVTGQHQAVAVLIAGADRVHFENTRMFSHQDTLYFQAPRKGETVRSFYRNCEIAGDVDYVFGQSTAYFQSCTFRSLGYRARETWVTAPSTDLRTTYGIVMNDCTFTTDAPSETRHLLGRQWFEGVRCTPYGSSGIAAYACVLSEISDYSHPPQGTISRTSLESVGKCIVLNSMIGGHINQSAPWGDWCGGHYDASGQYTAGPWNPRFRPFQCNASDFLENLEDWPDRDKLDYSDIDPEAIFLAEYNNSQN